MCMQRRHHAAFAMGRSCAVRDLEARGRTAERRCHIGQALCMSPLSNECSYHSPGDAQALHIEAAEADMLLLVVGE